MPELPEVEVLRRSLQHRLVGDRVLSVRAADIALREPLDAPRLRRECLTREVLALRRRAKYLWIDLSGGTTLVVHLGMSGRLTLVAGEEPPEPHEHVSLSLASGRRLRYRDPRRFGLLFSLPTTQLEDDRHFAHLGVEPLEPIFDGAFLRAAARGRRGPVKTFLMDARIVVGVGNIYVAEALHRAGVHPARSVARIGPARWNRIATAVRHVLSRAIEEGGTTLNDFADGDGQAGYFQVSLATYGRAGEACHRCRRPILRIVQANRSTFYCPGCQF